MRLWREQMSQAGRTAQTPPSCALGKVLAEDRNWHAGPQRACGLLRPQRNLTSQPWPPGQLSLRWEAGKAPEKPVPNSINSKKRNGTRYKPVLERGQERERGWNHRKPGSHTGCGTELPVPSVYLGEAGERTGSSRDRVGPQLASVPHLPWHG